MNERSLLTPLQLSSPKQLKKAVENRRAYTMNACELNVFETYSPSNLVSLKFDDLVITNMLRGKKVMHLLSNPGFDYLPGETVLVPANIEMLIDFPEASFDKPTQCTALAIDRSQLVNTINYLNEHYPLDDGKKSWKFSLDNFHFKNSVSITETLNKLLRISVGNDLYKDVLVDLALKELLIRVMQTQQIEMVDRRQAIGSSSIDYIVQYVRDHISDKLNIEDLCTKVCMSKAVFYRAFKRELGVSPLEFIIRERIRLAKQYLSTPNSSIKEACFVAGFNSINYFNRIFKKHEGLTPGAYQQIAS